jgi:uncharacterized protein
MSEAAEVVKALLDAFRAGEVGRARPLIAHDITWRIPGDNRIAGEVRGVDAYLERLATVRGAGVRPEVLDLLTSDRRVALYQHNRADQDGRTLDVEVLNLYTVDAGQVVRQDTFFADQAHADRFWAPLDQAGPAGSTRFSA